MHILTLILIIIVGAVFAACDGDYSGIFAIGKVIFFIVILFGTLYLFTNPRLLILPAILGLIVWGWLKLMK